MYESLTEHDVFKNPYFAFIVDLFLTLFVSRRIGN
jgi:hypothetical protein